jgi:hypothetical protein
VSANEFNQHASTDVPFVENFTYESEFPDIKPPITTTSKTRHGECMVIAGTESFSPIIIYTSASDYPTQPGTIITSLAVNPQLLVATRLSKLAENYTRWYPKRLVVEYVPQGSALDIGALISIPTLDPEDSFTSSQGLDAIRRALAYERSVNFNIFDKPQFLLPEPEEDEPYYITVGQNARQEISHVWHCMAQSGFPARDTETERILGWFKLHYVIELYEPRISNLNSPLIEDSTITNVAIPTFFGSDYNDGYYVITSVPLTLGLPFTSTLPTYWRIRMRFDLTYNATLKTVKFNFAEGSVKLKANTILYLRLISYPQPVIAWYTNLSDLFNDTNRATVIQNDPLDVAVSGGFYVETLTANLD